MFTKAELNALDRRYFHVYEATPTVVTLKSKNTRHFWKVNVEGKAITLYHSHQGDGNYHVQCHTYDLESAVLVIKDHDRYQLSNRKKEDNDYDFMPLLSNAEYFAF